MSLPRLYSSDFEDPLLVTTLNKHNFFLNKLLIQANKVTFLRMPYSTEQKFQSCSALRYK